MFIEQNPEFEQEFEDSKVLRGVLKVLLHLLALFYLVTILFLKRLD
jgi:hypothetical protein